MLTLALVITPFAATPPVGVSPNLPDPYSASPAQGGVVIPKNAKATDYHIFTDTGGKTLTAQILSMAGTMVNLKRDDGQNVQFALSSFSKVDQAYIIEILLKQYAARGQPIFEISAVTDKTVATPAKIDGGTRVKWNEHYRLTLKNQTTLALDNLEARLIIFKGQLLPDVPGTAPSNVQLLPQSQTLAAAPPNGKTTLEADAIPMEQILANDGGQFPNTPAVHSETDKMLAVWVRIYDSNNFLVQEWCSNLTVAKLQSWDAAWSIASGKNSKANH